MECFFLSSMVFRLIMIFFTENALTFPWPWRILFPYLWQPWSSLQVLIFFSFLTSFISILHTSHKTLSLLHLKYQIMWHCNYLIWISRHQCWCVNLLCPSLVVLLLQNRAQWQAAQSQTGLVPKVQSHQELLMLLAEEDNHSSRNLQGSENKLEVLYNH